MACLKCGWCCTNLEVPIVIDPELGPQPGNIKTIHGFLERCPHLQGDVPGKYSCAIHDKEWYAESPCGTYNPEDPCICGFRIYRIETLGIQIKRKGPTAKRESPAVVPISEVSPPLYGYIIDSIDDTEGLLTVQQYLESIHSGAESLWGFKPFFKACQEFAKKELGWEGDSCMGPFVFFRTPPNKEPVISEIVFRQYNNGSTYLVSSREMDLELEAEGSW